MENHSQEWKRFTTEELEIVLPATYIGGHPKKDKKAIEAAISRLPEKYQKSFTEQFKSGSQDDKPFMAIDTSIDDTYDYLTFVSSFVENLPLFQHGTSIEKYLAESFKKLGKNSKLVEQGLVNLQNYQAGRLIIHVMENAGLFRKPTRTLQIGITYTIKISSRMWNIFFYTTPARYDMELPVFEQSIDSIVIKAK